MKTKYLKKLRGVHHCSFNLNVVECVCVCVGGGGDAGLQHGGGGHHRQLLTQPVRHQVYARCPSYNKITVLHIGMLAQFKDCRRI